MELGGMTFVAHCTKIRKCIVAIFDADSGSVLSRHSRRLLTRGLSCSDFNIEVTIHTLPHLKCIRLLSVRSSHLPFKIQ